MEHSPSGRFYNLICTISRRSPKQYWLSGFSGGRVFGTVFSYPTEFSGIMVDSSVIGSSQITSRFGD